MVSDTGSGNIDQIQTDNQQTDADTQVISGKIQFQESAGKIRMQIQAPRLFHFRYL